jgi:hypothetical protein
MRYVNWRELATECKKSGMSVSAWSKKNNIPGTTCRQWLKKLKNESPLVDADADADANANQDSGLSLWGKIELKESIQKKPMAPSPAYKSNICLHYHGWRIELNSNFDPSLLKQVMKVVESVC